MPFGYFVTNVRPGKHAMTSYNNFGGWLAGSTLVARTLIPSLRLSARGNTGPCDIVVFGSPFAVM